MPRLFHLKESEQLKGVSALTPNGAEQNDNSSK